LLPTNAQIQLTIANLCKALLLLRSITLMPFSSEYSVLIGDLEPTAEMFLAARLIRFLLAVPLRFLAHAGEPDMM
jgi:hypothetical protein